MNKVKIIFSNDDPRWEYVRGGFPTNKEQARDCWMSISCSLAPENLAEDGELPYHLQIQKRRDVLKDAKLLVKHGFKCPSDIADMCDDDGLIKYKAKSDD